MRIDAHVHLVGDGSGGSGCWYRPRGLVRLGEPFMLRGFGLDRSGLGDLDRAYVDRLLGYIKASSLDAAALFAQDEVYAESGDKMPDRGTFHVPNDCVFSLAAEHGRFLPVVSIHPARRDALDELDRCVEKGAVALKLLPNCHNVDCSLPRYRPFWERMAAAGLPLIAHTGAEAAVEEIRPELSDPGILRAPLEAGVTVIAAHCGLGSLLLPGRNHFRQFKAMLAEHPRLYGDTSSLNLPTRGRALKSLLSPEVLPRLIHGSDVPVPAYAVAPLLCGLIDLRTYLRLRLIRNPIERDYQLKRASGFPEPVFRRAAGLLKLASRRPPQPAP